MNKRFLFLIILIFALVGQSHAEESLNKDEKDPSADKGKSNQTDSKSTTQGKKLEGAEKALILDLAEQKEENLDFSSIKTLLKNDKLQEELKRKQASEEKAKILEEERKKNRFFAPGEEDFWNFVSELWLVKNIDTLNWNFQRPDFGLTETFSKLLKLLGHYEVKFKLLMIDTPNIPHMILPSKDQSIIFLLSLPFIRSLDLTKREISLLMLEDFFRQKLKFFRSFASVEGLKDFFGKNFYEQKWDLTPVELTLKKYDEFIYKSGHTFQQQFEITKRMDQVLRNHSELRSAYLELLKKMDHLVKSDPLYKPYNRLYPSPEMQLKWLTLKTQSSTEE